MKILVVDDHALVREGLRQALKGLDEQIEVLEASACARAFELADLHPDLDLVLMDFMMPDGAAGYLSKGGNSHDMLSLLRQVLAGEDPRPRLDKAKPTPHLTLRQEQVLGLLLAGASNKIISRKLHISDETTSSHVSAILRFFGVESRIQAVLAAGRLGYTAIPPYSDSTSPL